MKIFITGSAGFIGFYTNVEKEKTKLGYQPITPLKNGLQSFVQWFKEQVL